jgi:hypothetical protein
MIGMDLKQRNKRPWTDVVCRWTGLEQWGISISGGIMRQGALFVSASGRYLLMGG